MVETFFCVYFSINASLFASISYFFFCSLHWTSRAKKVDSKAINCVCWKVLLLSKKLLPPLLLLLLSSTPSVFSQLLSFLLSISSLLRWYIKNRLPWHDVCVYVQIMTRENGYLLSPWFIYLLLFHFYFSQAFFISSRSFISLSLSLSHSRTCNI